ncbi:MAG: molybdopterin converting factor subunit 1 [Methanomassiliicoccales archaeon]|nr:MAG: molybdopterin converting factor subunit 1 [Methanomassiliicoccales archaeon]
MKVNVKFFASYKEALGKDELKIELDKDSTVSDLLKALRRDYPELGKLMETLVVSINLEYASHDSVLKEGDEVALLPPVSGG